MPPEPPDGPPVLRTPSTTTLPAFSRRRTSSPKGLRRQVLLRFREAVTASVVALLVTSIIHIPQAGFLAIFLATVGLSPQLATLLDENRVAILSSRLPPRQANLTTGANLLALFTGVFLTFAAAAAYLGEANLQAHFGFAFEASGVRLDSILTRRFAHNADIFWNNLGVFVAFFGISFLYRAPGAMLAICWTAVVWAIILTVMIERGLAESTATARLDVLLVSLAILPHLLVEAASYALVAVSANFLSRAFAKYELSHPKVRAVGISVTKLLGLALLLLILAAAFEATLPALAGSLRG